MIALALVLLAAAPQVTTLSSQGLKSSFAIRADDAKTHWLLVETFGDDADWRTATLEAVKAANPGDAKAIVALNGSLKRSTERGSGVSVLSATLTKGKLTVHHVGGMGVIRVRKGVATRVVLPHSIIEDFIRLKKVPAEDQEDLRLHAPHREVVVRSLTVKPELEVETTELPVLAGDTFFLLSLKILTEEPLESFVKGHPEQLTRRGSDLVQLTF